MPTGYSDFHLIISRDQTRYNARVIESPVGQAATAFTLPFSPEEARRLSWRAGFTPRDIALIKAPGESASPPLTLQALGTRLFDALFSGSVEQLFFRSLDAAERSSHPLRIVLQFDDTPEVAELPWEFLYSRQLDRFLALSTRTPLVRYVPLPQPERPLVVSLPLHILAILSNPSDLPRLEVEQEWMRLNEGVAELVARGVVVLERLEAPTLAALRQSLRRQEVNILHFIGHGAIGPGSFAATEHDTGDDRGSLFFENEAGTHAEVSADEIATLLHDHEPLRLVFLNACHGAAGSAQNFFAGVAQKLVQQGVPAVIAMQFAVSDRSAITLAHEFYQSLAAALPLESALSEARKAIYSEGEEFEWGTPVLFSRSPDGVIVAQEEDATGHSSTAATGTVISGNVIAGDVITGDISERARNVVIGKNNIQITIGGHLMTLPFWLIAIGLLAVVALLTIPFIEPLLFPSQMSGGMNIAITNFGEMDSRGRIRSSALGTSLSKSVFDSLLQEYQEVYPELLGRDARSVEIWHDSLGREVKNVRLGIINGATPEQRAAEASQLASKINAHVVIYGFLTEQAGELGGEKGLQLDFYYAGETLRGEPDTIAGRHVLGEMITFPAALEQEPLAVQELLREPLAVRARALFWITVALIFDITDQQARALETLQEAQAMLAGWEDDEGQALLHYFIGREAFWLRDYARATAALEEAIRLKPNYANAYIGLGVVHYDRGQLFYTPQPVPEALVECVSLEHLDRAAQSNEEAMREIDLAIEFLQQAVAVAPASPWPPIEFPARLALGHVYRLKGQAYLLAAQPELGQAWFAKSLAEFDLAQQAFEDDGQPQYVAWTHLGRAATFQLQAYARLVSVQAEDDAAAVQRKQKEAAALFEQAAAECERCLEVGSEVADLVYRRKVLRCGCEYLRGLAQSAHAELQKLMEEQ